MTWEVDHPKIGAGNFDPKKTSLPLCVDLDGTLINGDLLWEGFLQLLKSSPLAMLFLPFWFAFGGLAHLKHQIALNSSLDPGTVRYNDELLGFLRTEHRRGRKLVLVTAADQQLAEKIAAYTGVFDEIYGTGDGVNLKGKRKAALLEQLFGPRGFEYAGNSSSDIHIWKIASAAYVVGDEKRVERASSVTTVLRIFPVRRNSPANWLAALRLRHWSKNLLMLAPLLLAHRLTIHSLVLTLAGVLLFGVCSSGIYIINDLLDLHSDRAHPWNNKRPFASGQLSVPSGLISAGALLAFSLAGAWIMNWRFLISLALYALTAILYSLRLKRIPILDVFVLSSFYTFRIWAGALISSVPLSLWFMAFSLFFFLSLAMAKRYSELVHAADQADSGISGRSYRAADRELLMNIGMASCFSAIVILSLYVHSAEISVLYRKPEFMLLICPLILYWTCRIWLKAHRGELNEDPVTLAITDPVSYLVALIGLIVILASLSHF